MTTYNQEKYIGQAIDSVLMQKVNFDYEVVIGEDASTDRTREIVLDYQRRYPDRIHVFFRDKVTADADRARGFGGKTNFVETFKACRGHYIATLDGDDYWISPHKLQKQVDFLDQHRECALCCHPALVTFEEENREPMLFPGKARDEITTLEHLLRENFIAAVTVMFRNKLFTSFPSWFYEVSVGDWALNILNLEHGDIGFINEPMAAYRKHSAGACVDPNQAADAPLKLIKFYELANQHLGFRYKAIIEAKIFMCWCALANDLSHQGDEAAAKAYALKCINAKPIHQHFWLKLKLLLRFYAPSLYQISKHFHRRLRPNTTIG